LKQEDQPGNPIWYADELAHAGPEHLDNAYVAGYDRKAGTDWDSEVAVLRELGLNEEQCLVDLGAGTGGLALAAAPFCRRVVAVDVSPAMLASLRAKTERLQLRNIECVEGGFLRYQHTGEPADFAYSRHALHQLPDFWKAVALSRMHVILKPGGVLRLRDLVFSFDVSEAHGAIDAWLSRASKHPEDGWTRTELETHLRDEHSTFSWLLEPMLEQAGFEIRQAAYDPSGIYAAYVCVSR
jgi:ubiquinone/menaquinone biosynthesis C-methylase UbiE